MNKLVLQKKKYIGAEAHEQYARLIDSQVRLLKKGNLIRREVNAPMK